MISVDWISVSTRSHRKINEWNKLSTDCVAVSYMNMFKNKIDTYLRITYTRTRARTLARTHVFVSFNLYGQREVSYAQTLLTTGLPDDGHQFDICCA